MKRWVTIVGAATLVAVCVGQFVWMKRMAAEIPRFGSAEVAAQVAQALDVAEGLERGKDAWPPFSLSLVDPPRVVRMRMVSFLQAAGAEEAEDLRPLLALVLLESFHRGEIDEARLIASLPEVSEPDRSALAAAYPGWAPAAGRETRSEAVNAAGWAGDILEARTAEAAGDAARAAAAQARILARAETELAPSRRRAWFSFVLVLAGLALGGGIGIGAIPLPERSAPAGFAVPPWDGAGVCVRGQLIALAVSTAGGLVSSAIDIDLSLGFSEAPAYFFGAIGSAAALVYANAALSRSKAAFDLSDVVGVDVPLLPAAALGLVLFAASRLANFAGSAFDFAIAHGPAPWAPPLAHSTAWASASFFLSVVVAAPIVEEILFRGLLFGALRGALGFAGAAAVSGLAFCVGHDRSLGGYLALMAWSVLFAFAYQRTRTLLPLMLGHALGNLFAFAGRV